MMRLNRRLLDRGIRGLREDLKLLRELRLRFVGRRHGQRLLVHRVVGRLLLLLRELLRQLRWRLTRSSVPVV
jgi:hypothetical protein